MGQVNQFWDEAIFLHDEHRNYHSDYNGKYTIIPNIKENLVPITDALNKVSTLRTVTGNYIEDASKTSHAFLIAQDVYYEGPQPTKEFYLSILLDRSKGMNVVMYSTEGGMDIEEVAHNTPEKIFKEWVHPGGGLQGFQARKIAFNLGLEGNAFREMVKFVSALYKAYESIDASLFEINPVLKTSDNKIIEVVPAYHNMYEYYGEDFEGLSEYNDRLFGTLALIFGRTCDQALWYAKKFLYYLNPKD